MDNQIEQAGHQGEASEDRAGSYDYAHVSSTARIALYDDLRSAPRVTEIPPGPTGDYIESLASKIYEQAKGSGGTIPYTVIREVSENFIHAQFTEVTVSILDSGNTIRFADQGPGICQKDKAQLPGFTSAVEPMKHYIRGVGSGLPIVKEYLDFSHGTITIEDNLGTGSVVTISLDSNPAQRGGQPVETIPEMPAPGFPGGQPYDMQPNPYAQAPAYTSQPYQEFAPSHPVPGMQAAQGMQSPVYPVSPGQPYNTQGYPQQQAPAYGYPQAAGFGQHPLGQGAYQQHSVSSLVPPLSQRERDFLPIFLNEGALGVTDLARITGVPQSSTYVTLSKLEQAGLIEKTVGQKRILTDLGYQVASTL